jgi:pseudaminic acid biosynthesis-associated methylase
VNVHEGENGGLTGGAETAQMQVWKGEFGRAYTDRNTLDVEEMNSLWSGNYGISRREINRIFLRGIPKDASFLEVGCNVGNQLLQLQEDGYTNLSGIELQSYAVEIAKSRVEDVAIRQGSTLALPYKNDSFDVVFTSGVLIHIAPEDLSRAMAEIHRCAKTYIWGTEYYAPDVTSVNYRGHEELLWKMDYARRYLESFKDLELVREQHLPYLENQNVDTVFLLRKKR